MKRARVHEIVRSVFEDGEDEAIEAYGEDEVEEAFSGKVEPEFQDNVIDD